METGYNKSWRILAQLQRQLKKEFLLVEKEQQQKIKLKREIEDLVRSYHQLQIELHHPGAELLKEQGFENCYNFIKDVVTGISNNLELGKAIIYQASEQTTLSHLVIHGLYENLQTNDAFHKDITRLIYNLTRDLSDSFRAQKDRERVIESWRLYMQKVEHQNYFEQIANQTIIALLSEDSNDHSSQSPEQLIGVNQRTIKKRLKRDSQEKLLNAYIDKVESESLMCLPSIKIPLRALLNTTSDMNAKQNFRRIWGLVSYFYLQPFVKILANNEVPQNLRENMLKFVDQLVVDWGFTGELALQSLQLKDMSNEFIENKLPRINKIVSKLIQVNQERMKYFKANSTESSAEIQIKINGGCLSLVQLRDLLVLLNSHKEIFIKINQRVINRTLKIFEISQNLQILNRDRPGMQFTSLAELKYEQSIISDYYKNYTVVYRGQTLKQMLKQVLVETHNIWELRSQQRNSLAEIFQGLVTQNRQYHTGAAISAQLEMKIRYLIYLLGKRTEGNQGDLLMDLGNDLKDRDATNIKLFQDTKFSLLKVYCNLRTLKNQFKHQKEAQKKRINKINLIHRLNTLRLDFCISSKASRNLGQKQQEESIDKYKYRLSSADDILILPINECIHKENVFTGRASHANCVTRLITIFANLQEVKQLIAYPSYTNKESNLYCNQGKIGEAFHIFLGMVTQNLKIVQEDKAIIEHVMVRFMNELILGTNSSPFVSASDRLLLQKIDIVTQMRNQEPQSPRKKLSTRKGSYQFMEKNTLQDSFWLSYQSQLYEMGKRYFNLLIQANTANEKIKRLREIVDIYRIAIGRQEGQGKNEIQLQKLIQKSIIVARPRNFISQLAFIEMFLAEERLISGDGKVMKQFQRAAQSIIKTKTSSSKKKELNEI